MAMSARVPRSRALTGMVVLAIVACTCLGACRLAFVASPMAPPSMATQEITGRGLFLNGVAPVQAFAARAEYSGNLVGVAVGVACSLGLAASAVRHQRSRVAARVAPGAPSLIQVLEQKGLLSTVEKLGLLSKAEAAGVGIATVEELGLLVLAENLGLLTLAETVLTNPTTPFLLLAGAAVLGGLTFLDVSAADFGFAQWVIAGALGAPALVLGVAALAILVLFGGARRTRNLDKVEKKLEYSTSSGFKEQAAPQSVSLLDVVEKKRLLSFLENNRLLTLAGGLVDKPLTLTEKLGVLSTLEKTKLLSQIESSASDKYGAAGIGGLGAVLVGAALVAALFVPGAPGLAAAVLLGLPGLAVLVVGIVLGIFQAPSQYVR